MRNNRTTKIVALAALGTLTALASGCASTADPSPGLYTLSRSDAEQANTYSMASDTNIRQIIDDLERTFYTDRPSRLTPINIPY